jgi:tetratricopeptide (TPR) repeat protein
MRAMLTPRGFGSALIALIAWQVQPKPASPSLPDYSKEAVVFELVRMDTSFDAQGTRTTDETIRARAQSQAGVAALGTLAFGYHRDLGTVDIEYVRVRKPSGEVIETPPSSAIDLPTDNTRQVPMFSDAYAKHVNIQGLAVGDVVEFKTHARERSLFPGQFWLEHSWGESEIMLDAEMRVTVPASSTPIVRTRGAQPTETAANGQRTYAWKFQRLQAPTQTESYVRAYDSRNRRGEIQLSSFHSWAEVGEAFRTLWHAHAEVTPAVRTKAVELTKSATSDVEKRDRIFAFVATKIRYVSISLGEGSIEPHSADDVLKTGYGDCKDKHILLVALLEAVGLHAEAALIGVGLGAGFDADVPSPIQFNHVITRMAGEGTPTWLDATLEVAPPGFLGDLERDRSVLLLPSSGTATIIRTPATPSRPGLWQIDEDGALDSDGRFDAQVVETFTGDPELVLRAAFRQLAEAQWPDLVKQISIPARFGGTVSDLVVSPVDDTSAPLRVTYHYTIEPEKTWADGQFMPPLPFMGINELAKEPPPIPVALGTVRKQVTTVTVRLPEKVSAKLPSSAVPDTRFEHSFGTYRYRLSLDGRTYKVQREFAITQAELPIAEFPNYRKFYTDITDVTDSDYLAVHKEVPWAFGEGWELDWYDGASASATQVLKSAADQVEGKQYAPALSALRDLSRAEPKDPAVWLFLAWAQSRSGDSKAAIATLRSGIASAPSPSLYKQLASDLADAGEVDEATKTWAAGRDAYPDEHDFARVLAERLITAGRFAEAGDVLTHMTQRELPSARLQWNLGRAYLGLKQNDQAIAAFRRVADLDSSPYALNEAAWALADAGVGSSDAVDLARRSVAGTEALVSKQTLATLEDAGLRAMVELGHQWDTLAWAQFRDKNLTNAERYQKAAWQLNPSALLSEHLAEIAEAKGDRIAALRYYLFARNSDAALAAASAGVDRLRPSSSETEAAAAQAQALVDEAFVMSLPRLPDSTGAAEVLIQVSADGAIGDVKFLSGPDALRAEAETLRSHKTLFVLPSTSLKVIRGGTLTCAAGESACQFRVQPVSQVKLAK